MQFSKIVTTYFLCIDKVEVTLCCVDVCKYSGLVNTAKTGFFTSSIRP